VSSLEGGKGGLLATTLGLRDEAYWRETWSRIIREDRRAARSEKGTV